MGQALHENNNAHGWPKLSFSLVWKKTKGLRVRYGIICEGIITLRILCVQKIVLQHGNDPKIVLQKKQQQRYFFGWLISIPVSSILCGSKSSYFEMTTGQIMNI